MKKRIVSFDLDGTLVDAHYGDVVWNRGIPEEYAKKHGLALPEARAYITGEYRSVGDKNLLWYDIEYWIDRFDLPVSPQTLLDRFESFIMLKPNAEEVLRALSRRFTLVIASNAARIFVEKELGHTGIGTFFTEVISATTDFRMVKKSESFYRRLCAALKVGPGEMVHVGDHPAFDYEAPRSIGIDAYYLSSDGTPHINTLHGLEEILERL